MNTKTKVLIAALLILFGVLLRLLPHAANMTPLIAIALVSGVYLGRSYALLVPLIAMIASDIFIGFYSTPIMLSVYASMALAGLLGFALRDHRRTEARIAVSFTASTLFFLVTNWAVWQFGTMYAHSLSGLVESYTLALPFYRNALVGDLFYSMSLFTLFELVITLSAKGVLRGFIAKPAFQSAQNRK
jgi:hypothetical protein